MKEKNINTQSNNSNLYEFESLFWQKNQSICGVDEVGRGCLAGPIVTAAVILNKHAYHANIRDSKTMSSIQLENMHAWIIQNSTYAIGISNTRLIDQKNIYRTTQITMKKALLHLLSSSAHNLAMIAIDAMPLSLEHTPFYTIPIESYIKGESKSASIAAASIIAKVTRDRMMKNIDHAFPIYGLAQHKGYGTAQHIQALKEHKASVIHRKTFIKNFTQEIDHESSQQQKLFC